MTWSSLPAGDASTNFSVALIAEISDSLGCNVITSAVSTVRFRAVNGSGAVSASDASSHSRAEKAALVLASTVLQASMVHPILFHIFNFNISINIKLALVIAILIHASYHAVLITVLRRTTQQLEMSFHSLRLSIHWHLLSTHYHDWIQVIPNPDSNPNLNPNPE